MISPCCNLLASHCGVSAKALSKSLPSYPTSPSLLFQSLKADGALPPAENGVTSAIAPRRQRRCQYVTRIRNVGRRTKVQRQRGNPYSRFSLAKKKAFCRQEVFEFPLKYISHSGAFLNIFQFIHISWDEIYHSENLLIANE